MSNRGGGLSSSATLTATPGPYRNCRRAPDGPDGLAGRLCSPLFGRLRPGVRCAVPAQRPSPPEPLGLVVQASGPAPHSEAEPSDQDRGVQTQAVVGAQC